MATFPQPVPRIHEEQIVLVHHDSHNNWHCPDRSCPCWADEREDESVPIGYDELDQSGTHAPDCRCPWCSAEEFGSVIDHAPWLW